MGFIVDRPGLTLVIVGLVAFLARNIFSWVPLIGGAMNAILLFVGVFFVIGGVWMFVVGRSHDPN
jgi:hypothetical protein